MILFAQEKSLLFGFVWWLNCESGKSLLPCFVLRRRHTGKQDAEQCVFGENDLRVKLLKDGQ